MVATRSGFLEGAEVVEVRYDPAVVSYADLAQRAASRECASSAFVLDESQAAAAKRVFGGGVRRAPGPVRPDEEPKYYLLQTPLRHVPMTELQAVRINALVQKGGWERLLSPRQKELLVAVKQDPEAGWPVVVGTEVGAAWRAADEVLRKPGGR